MRPFLHYSAASILVVSAVLARSQSAPDPHNTAKAEIARLEDRWLKAIEAADVPALDAILADDFVRPAPAAGQFITKSQLLAYYRSHKQSAALEGKHIENLVVQFYADMAIARGTVVTSDANGRAGARNLFTDVFVSRGGRWQAVSAQENDVRADSAVDGKTGAGVPHIDEILRPGSAALEMSSPSTVQISLNH